MPADGLALSGAKPSAGTVLRLKLCNMFSSKFLNHFEYVWTEQKLPQVDSVSNLQRQKITLTASYMYLKKPYVLFFLIIPHHLFIYYNLHLFMIYSEQALWIAIVTLFIITHYSFIY